MQSQRGLDCSGGGRTVGICGNASGGRVAQLSAWCQRLAGGEQETCPGGGCPQLLRGSVAARDGVLGGMHP